MRADLLLRLADHLENVVAKKPELFDLGIWARRMDCGTVCCAIGHAASLPEFQSAGLTLEWDLRPMPSRQNDQAEPIYETASGMIAVSLLLQIEEEEAELLFSPDGYYWESYLFPAIEGTITPTVVAARLRKFVAMKNEAVTS